MATYRLRLIPPEERSSLRAVSKIGDEEGGLPILHYGMPDTEYDRSQADVMACGLCGLALYLVPQVTTIEVDMTGAAIICPQCKSYNEYPKIHGGDAPTLRVTL